VDYVVPDELRAALSVQSDSWLDDALRRVAAEPSAIARIFPAAGRHCGRDPLPGSHWPQVSGFGWTVDDAARVLLLIALPLRDQVLAAEVGVLYRYGDAAEKRAVLRALPLLPIEGGTELLHDAIRTNDPRLVAAALGPYAAHLDDAMWRQAVLKCVFMGVPLECVYGLAGRADGELVAMIAGLAEERHAAGRDMAADATELLRTHQETARQQETRQQETRQQETRQEA
jgi:hypothetical protein